MINNLLIKWLVKCMILSLGLVFVLSGDFTKIISGAVLIPIAFQIWKEVKFLNLNRDY